MGILKEHRIDLKEFGGYLKEVYGVNAWSEIKVADYDQIVGLAQNWPHKGSAAPTN